MHPAAQIAEDAKACGKVHFFPRVTFTRPTPTSDGLAEKRDWCISRQLGWGHPNTRLSFTRHE